MTNFWVAKDMNGDIWLYAAEPHRMGDHFVTWGNKEIDCFQINANFICGTLTWENSPKQIRGANFYIDND